MLSSENSPHEAPKPPVPTCAVREGVFLQSQGIPVYSGGLFHETPLTLLTASVLLRSWSQWLPLLFVLCDLLTAYTLGRVAAAYSRKLVSAWW